MSTPIKHQDIGKNHNDPQVALTFTNDGGDAIACDTSALNGAELMIELWSPAGVCEQTLTMGINQIPWLTQLLAGHDYAIYLQPAIINNQAIAMPEPPVVFTPLAERVQTVNVAFKQTIIDSAAFTTVQATVVGLPKGTPPQRYRLSNSQYQYVFTLDSHSQPQILPMRLAPGQYWLQVADIFFDSTLWRCVQDAPIRLLQSVNHITLEFVPDTLHPVGDEPCQRAYCSSQ